MVGHVEKQDLRRPDGEEMQEALVPQALVETLAQRPADGAEAAHGHDGDRPRKRLVAAGQMLCGRELVQHVVEGNPPLQGLGDGIPGEPAGPEARI